jgi:Na+-translocating ferredoxin:NAD+ oxidoreductase RnfC subunit
MHEHRRVPVKKLVQRLGLADYDVPAPWTDEQPRARVLTYPLHSAVGAPAEAVVAEGDSVRAGQVLAAIAAGKLGAQVHSAVDGRVTAVGDAIVVERT